MEKEILLLEKNQLKKWVLPQVTIFGNMRDLTKGSQKYGDGDVGYEHQKPITSPGGS